MTRLSRMLGDEYVYLWYSLTPLVLLAVLLAMVCIDGWNADAAVRSAYRDYLQQRRSATEAGEDPDAMLSLPVHVRVTGSGDAQVTETDNPVRESLDALAGAVRSVRPGVFVPTALGTMTLLVGPLAFSVWGVALATYDYSNKTVKLKAARGPWPQVVGAKIVAGVTTMAAVVAVAVALSEAAAQVLWWYVLRGVPGHDVSVRLGQPAHSPTSLIAQYAVAVLVGAVFCTLGVCGGVVFRRSLIPLVIAAVYNLFIPSMGRYDLKNATAVVARGVFSFGRDSQIITPLPLEPALACGILWATLASATAVSLWAAARQSKVVV